MPLRFEDRTINVVSDLLEFIKDDERALLGTDDTPSQSSPIVWYRGLGDINYHLVPTFHRAHIPMTNERHLMNLFRQNAYQFVETRPQGEWEWTFLMRHHGLLSRLLDWTESPLVGLYFATSFDLGEGSDGVMWCLLPSVLNAKADSTRSTMDNIPLFTEEDERPGRDDSFLQNYLPSRLGQFSLDVRVWPAAGMAARTNSRIQAQHGVFTIHHTDPTALDQREELDHLWRFLIPSESKRQINDELRLLKVTELTVFPDLDRVANDAKERL